MIIADIHIESGLFSKRYIAIPHKNSGLNKAGSGNSEDSAINDFKRKNNLPESAIITRNYCQYTRG